jgi:hypothetical protein
MDKIMSITPLNFNQIMAVVIFDVGVSFLSIPILFIVFRRWAYDSAITKKNRKALLKKYSWFERFTLLFLLEYKNNAPTKRYIAYYYAYLLVVVVLMVVMWLRVHEILSYDKARLFWMFKLLLDMVISSIYLRQTRPKYRR